MARLFLADESQLKVLSTGLVLDPRPTLVRMGTKEVQIYLQERINLDIFSERAGRSACSNSTKIILGQTFAQYSHELISLMKRNNKEEYINIIQDSTPLFANDQPQETKQYVSGEWTLPVLTNELQISLKNGSYDFKKTKASVLISEHTSNPVLFEFSRPPMTFQVRPGPILIVHFKTAENVKFLLTSLQAQSNTFNIPISRGRRSLRSFFDLASFEDLKRFKTLVVSNNNLTQAMNEKEFSKMSKKINDLGLMIERDQALAKSLKTHLCDLAATFDRSVSIAFLKLQSSIHAQHTFEIITKCLNFGTAPFVELKDFIDHQCKAEFPNVAECNQLNFFYRNSKCVLSKVSFFESEIVISLKLEMPTGPKSDVKAYRLHALPVYNETKDSFYKLDLGSDPSIIKLDSGHLTYINNCLRTTVLDDCDILDVDPSKIDCVKSILWENYDGGLCHVNVLSRSNRTCFHLDLNQGLVISSSKDIKFKEPAPLSKSGFVPPPGEDKTIVKSGLFFESHSDNKSFLCDDVTLTTHDTHEKIEVVVNKELHRPELHFNHINFGASLAFENLENKIASSVLFPKPQFPRAITKPFIYGIYGFLCALLLLGIVFITHMTIKRLKSAPAVSIPY